MKPRIFVSSTFYDLKYVREDLAGFIRAHDFEPIMFEEGDIGYESGKPLDESCYETMRNADMAILIIGGQYGSNAAKQDTDKTDEFISITQKEFKSAVNSGIPVFAFVDAKVNTEYDVYKNNAEMIKKDNNFKFNQTKDIRVFNFIRSIYAIGSIPVNEFVKVSDIKDFLSKQWSDMFKKYLLQCREEKEIETIKSSVSKLENLVNNMSVMLEAIGKNVLKENSNEYKDTKAQQKAIEICEKIVSVFSNINVCHYKKISKDEIIDRLFKLIFIIKKHSEENVVVFKEHFIRYERIDGVDFEITYENTSTPLLIEICEELESDDMKEMVKEEFKQNYLDQFLV